VLDATQEQAIGRRSVLRYPTVQQAIGNLEVAFEPYLKQQCRSLCTANCWPIDWSIDWPIETMLHDNIVAGTSTNLYPQASRKFQMTRLLSLSLLCFSFIASSAFAADMHTLPETGPVIVFDYAGGFTPPPLNDDAAMTIYADGKVVLGNRFKEDATIEGKISEDELHALVSFAIEKNAMTFDPADVKKAIAEKQKKAAEKGLGIAFPQIADAPSTVIKVNANGKSSVASYYALGMAANMHKDIPQLVELQEVAKKLGEVRRRVMKEAEKE